MTALAEKMKPLERVAPKIDPNRMIVNVDGFAFRSFMVRLPKDIVADDLKEPGIWRAVQCSGKALRKHDHLYCVAFDEAWAADAVVASASNDSAVLCKPRLIQFPERYDKLFEDDLYRVAWMGSGYVVERKSDGHRMTQPTANAALAERMLAQLYPARVG